MTHFRLRYHKGSFPQEELFLSRFSAVCRAAALMADNTCYAFTLHDAEGIFLMGESDMSLLGNNGKRRSDRAPNPIALD
jgi:hypothetical protein